MKSLDSKTSNQFLSGNSHSSRSAVATRAPFETFRNNHFNRANENGRLLTAKPALENTLLSSMPRSILLELLPVMQRVSFSGQQQIFRCNDLISSIYFPESCVISEYQILEDGRTVEIAMTGRDSAIGLPSIFDREPAANWAQITLPGKALKINIEILRNIIDKNRTLQEHFFRSLNLYIRQMTQSIVCHSYHSVEQKFCTWLAMLHDRKPDGKLALTQEKIARTLGVQRPSLTNIAHSLREKNVIAYTRGQIFIVDREKLDRLSCMCNRTD